MLAWLAAAAIALPGATLRAQPVEPQDHRRVLLLVESAGDPFMDRISAELTSLGLDVVVRAPRGSIETSARTEHSDGRHRMLPARNGVEVWMADETSGRSLLRQAIVDESKEGPSQNLIALQTAELLRTSLFPRRPPEGTKPVPPPNVPAISQVPVPPPSGESGLTSSVGLLYSAGGASPAWQAWLSFQRFWNRRFGLALAVSAPVHRGTISGPEGTADIGAIIAGVEAIARFNSERRRLFLATGLGAGFASVLAQGRPTPNASAQLAGGSSTAYTGLGYARVTLGWRPSSWLGLGLSGLAGTTVARVQVRFAGNDAGDWGVPLLGAALFGEVDWR